MHAFVPLEQDPEKWNPVFGKDHAPTQYPDRDSLQLDRIMVWDLRRGSGQPDGKLRDAVLRTAMRGHDEAVD
jgi:hypothetical protein